MQTWEAITARRNVREFTDEPVPTDQLDRILEAARRTPSSQNTQPWDFVVVTERNRLVELAKVWRGAGHVASSAATIALVVAGADDAADARRRESVAYDLGQATMSIMLAAADLGLGTAHAAVADQDLARQVLGLPPERRCAYLIAVGHPAGRPLRPIARPDRRPFEEVVHRERW
jgi:nitroreductase